MSYDCRDTFIFFSVLHVVEILLLLAYFFYTNHRIHHLQPVVDDIPPLLSGPSQDGLFSATTTITTVASVDVVKSLPHAPEEPTTSLSTEEHHPHASPSRSPSIFSPEDLSAARQRLQYQDGLVHFAIAGIAGSGKSALINALRGLRNTDAGASLVGGHESPTLQVTRWPDPNPTRPHVWYDIPGAGTLQMPEWEYFKSQSLYAYDRIIVLFDNRFTLMDIAILKNARRFDIPTYIVRSKADQHIYNIMKEMGFVSDGSGNENRFRMYKAARQQFLQETKESVQANLKEANIPDQRVYIVSCDGLRGVVQKKFPKTVIDEMELCEELFAKRSGRG